MDLGFFFVVWLVDYVCGGLGFFVVVWFIGGFVFVVWGFFVWLVLVVFILVCLSFFYKIRRQWPLPLKKECLSHPAFPGRCRSCDKEGFIMPQFGAFIIYSL